MNKNNDNDDNDNDYFGELSISSLVSNDDDQNDTKDSDGGSTLYQRLQDLEEMAANFIGIHNFF